MLRFFRAPRTDWALVHQMGKVGSQTIEWSIRQSDPRIRVERHHFLHPPNRQRRAVLWSASHGVPDRVRDSQRHQGEAARKCVEDLAAANESLRLCVLSGYREPLAHVIAALFQNLPAVAPQLEPTADLERGCRWLDDLVKEMFCRFRNGELGPDWPEPFFGLLFDLALDWFDGEFAPVHDFDVYSHSPGKDGLLVVDRGRTRFIIYRLETLATQFPRILQAIPGLPRVVQSNQNLAKDKPCGALYEAFRRSFRPTEAMLEYYGNSKYYRHFYCTAEACASA